MLVELANHDRAFETVDERPSVTTVEIPDYDDGSTHDDALYTLSNGTQQTLSALGRCIPDGATLATPGPSLGGHSHEPGQLTAQQFKEHITDARLFNNGVTSLPGHEALLAVEAAWPKMGRGRPAWIKVHPGNRPDDHASDLQALLCNFYDVPSLEDYLRVDNIHDANTLKERGYWTRNGAPGENRAAVLPSLEALYTVDGRIMDNLQDGGDSLTAIGAMSGVGTGSTSTTITGASGLTASGLVGHRIYAFTASGNVWAWGNVISNTTTVPTVDQWYVPATPGGSAAANPGSPWAFVVVDGGMFSTWFAAIGSGGTPTVTNTDHTLATGGQTEYTQAGGTMIRKICPVATDVSASARTVTLVPVFTANSSDVPNLPKVIDIAGFFASMVPTFGGAGGPMKFEDAVSPTATIAALGDNLTLTEVISGS